MDPDLMFSNTPRQTIMAVYQSYLFTLIMPAAILAYINADLGPSPIYTWIAVRYLTLLHDMIPVG